MKHNKNKGFSLVELIIVIAIMAILIGVAVPVYSAYVDKSKMRKDIALVDEITHALQIAHGSGEASLVVENQFSQGMEKPVGYIVIGKDALHNGNYVYTKEQGASEGVFAQILTSNFGDDYATKLQLSYGDWNGDLGNFFTSASGMIDHVDQMGTDTLNMLETLGGFNLRGKGITYDGNGTLTFDIVVKKKSFPVFSQGYDNSSELLLSVADKVSKVPQETFVTRWDNPTGADEEFGLTSSNVDGGREHYSAARAAYNICLANYIRAYNDSFSLNGKDYTHESGAHSTQIEGYGEDAMELLGEKLGDIGNYVKDWKADVSFPQVVCDKLFDTPNADYEFTSCEACEKLLDEYKNSDRDKSDAINFYNTMKTGTTYDEETHGDDIFQWMKDEAEPFALACSEVNALIEGKSAIVITVYMRNGRLEFDYSPTLE